MKKCVSILVGVLAVIAARRGRSSSLGATASASRPTQTRR